jgi:hypothetical protein
MPTGPGLHRDERHLSNYRHKCRAKHDSACRRCSLHLKNSWMKPHSTMAHSAENRKGPMNLHFIRTVSCCQERAAPGWCWVSTGSNHGVPCAVPPEQCLIPRALHLREVFAFPCSMEAVCCQAADNRRCQNHRFQHNLGRKHRACGANTDAEAERLQIRQMNK